MKPYGLPGNCKQVALSHEGLVEQARRIKLFSEKQGLNLTNITDGTTGNLK
jgi:hypothetical protein